MGEQAEFVNLLTNEGAPRRPTKRLRPETADAHVFSLVDSDDDEMVFNPRQRDAAGQAAERHPGNPMATTYWGALEDGPRVALESGRPIFRPPSARNRRQPVPQQARQNPNPSPIVIDDDDDASSAMSPRPVLFRRFSDLVRQQSAGAGSVGAVGTGASPQALTARALAGNLAAAGPGIRNGLPGLGAEPDTGTEAVPLPPLQQQQQQQQSPLEEGAVLVPRPRRLPLHLAMARQARRLPGAEVAAGQASSAAAGASPSSSPTPCLRSVEDSDRQRQHLLQQRDQQRPQQLREAQLELQLQQHRETQFMQQNSLLVQQQLRQLQQQLHRRDQQDQQLQALGAAEDQEDTDMRLAVRLQAEEDERLARETASRMEQEDHHRLMASGSPAVAAAAAAAAAAAGAAAAAAGMVPGRRPLGPVEPEGGDADALQPRAVPDAASSEADAVDLAARWSRLDMLETLESAAEAGRTRRSAIAAMAAADSLLAAGRRATDRDRAGETRAADADADRDRDRNRDFLNMWRMARPVRGMPGLLFGGPREDVAAEAAAQEATAGVPGGSGGPGAGGGAGRPRWSSRALQDMLPAMIGLPYGLQRMWTGPGGGGGRAASGDEGPGGAYQAHRRSRHMAAYRESAMAMREQLIAAQRVGLPPHLLLSDRDFTPEDYEMLCRLDDAVENRKGAKDEQLAAMPTEVVEAGGRRRSDGNPSTCIICMEELAPGDVMKRLPCMHDFHSVCVDTWLKAKACCPVCQRELDA